MADAKETFDITGMTCAACEARVQRAASGVKGVSQAQVNLLKNSMELVYDGKPKTLDAVVAAIDKAGYGAAPRSRANTSEKAAAFVDPKIAADKVCLVSYFCYIYRQRFIRNFFICLLSDIDKIYR